MGNQPFNFPLSQNVVLNGSGYGIVQIQATRGDWVILYTTVTVSSQTLQPQVFVYRGLISPSNVVDSTYSGASDSSDTRILLRQGQVLIVEWQNGDPGAVATVTFSIVQYEADSAPAE